MLSVYTKAYTDEFDTLSKHLLLLLCGTFETLHVELNLRQHIIILMSSSYKNMRRKSLDVHVVPKLCYYRINFYQTHQLLLTELVPLF